MQSNLTGCHFPTTLTDTNANGFGTVLSAEAGTVKEVVGQFRVVTVGAG